jgi:hypothetical protein
MRKIITNFQVRMIQNRFYVYDTSLLLDCVKERCKFLNNLLIGAEGARLLREKVSRETPQAL